jgi:hypothetical protein
MRSVLRSLSALALASTCIAACGSGQDGTAARPARLMALRAASTPSVLRWRVVTRIAIPGKTVLMLSVAAVAPDDGWAIGFSMAPGGRTGHAIVERWSGRRWSQMPVPRELLGPFDAGYPPYAVIGASSPRNVWAFNQLNGAWLRWNGHHWSEGSLTKQFGPSHIGINSALVLGPDDVWTFGFRLNGQGNTIPWAARFNGRRWHVTPIPAGGLTLPVSAASAVSPSDIWAVIGRAGDIVGPAGPSGGALAHWNGQRWRPVHLPATLARHGDPASIAALSDSNIWVGGGTANDKEGLTETAAHWNGSSWQVMHLPASASRASFVLSSIVPDSRRGLQALATCFLCTKPSSESRLWRLSAGRWKGPIRPPLTRHPSILTSLTWAGRSNSEWATGFTTSSPSDDGIIALYGPDPR